MNVFNPVTVYLDFPCLFIFKMLELYIEVCLAQLIVILLSKTYKVVKNEKEAV